MALRCAGVYVRARRVGEKRIFSPTQSFSRLMSSSRGRTALPPSHPHAATSDAACGWDGGNAVRPRLLDISRLNDWVGEKILFSPTRLARTYTPAQRSAMLPGYFISNSVPTLENPSAWRLRVDGLVRQPLDLSLDDL